MTDVQIRTDHFVKAGVVYPAAATSYDQTLASAAISDKSRSAFYANINRQIGYAYLTNAYTATDVQGLTSKIKAAVTKRQKEVVIRYTRGATLKSDMKKAFGAQKGLTGYSYSYEDFTRTQINDKLLRISIKYA